MKFDFIQTYENGAAPKSPYKNIIEMGFRAETDMEKCLLAALASSRKRVTISGDGLFVTLEAK